MRHFEHGVQHPTRRFSLHQSLMIMVLVIVLSVVSNSAWAMLVLQVNPSSMTVSIGGSETATLIPLMDGEGQGVWGFADPPLGGAQQIALDGGLTVLTSSGSPSVVNLDIIVRNTDSLLLVITGIYLDFP